MRIPPFRDTNFSSAKTIIFQESRASLIGYSGARNAGKSPGQRLDGRPDAHHDSRELWGYLLYGPFSSYPAHPRKADTLDDQLVAA
jgi:hypothetical protein